ncbi:MAG: cytochrome c oxidase subunit II [Gemmatimonadota bacterium]
MNVDLYEKIWMWAALGIIVLFLASIGVTTFGQAIEPPSRVETIDPETVRTDAEFGRPGVTIHNDGSATVVVQAFTFAFLPNEIRVPHGRPVTFRITSPDVIHGFQIVQTNGNVMVVPGYVSQFTTTFDRAGEYLIVCNEYCGLGHHIMSARLIVGEGSGASGAAAMPAGGAR